MLPSTEFLFCFPFCPSFRHVSQGAYGGRRGRVRGLGLAATAWAQGGPLSPVGPRWSGRHSAGALSSLALTCCTDFFALGHGVQRGGCEVLLVARRRELAGGGGASECAPRTWSLGNVTWRICLRSKSKNLHSVEIYKHTLSHKLATHLAFFTLQYGGLFTWPGAES